MVWAGVGAFCDPPEVDDGGVREVVDCALGAGEVDAAHYDAGEW